MMSSEAENSTLVALTVIAVGVATAIFFAFFFYGRKPNRRKLNRHHPIQSKPHEFKLRIAVDFGTDGIGIAFGFKDKTTGNVIVKPYSKWKTTDRKPTLKTKTQLVLKLHPQNEPNEVFFFGNAAKTSFMALPEDSRQSEYALFERFKMALYEGAIAANRDNKCDIQSTLTSTNGITLASDDVFIAAFTHIRKEAIAYTKAKVAKEIEEDINDEDIQWILTVPAIWSEKAKHKMKQWVIEAKLMDGTIKDQCRIVYEPDCASLSVQKEYCANREGDAVVPFFQKGDKYILIDAGGGTVDIACHQVVDYAAVEEIHHPSGGPWGSCYIDDDYITLLSEIFGTRVMEEYKDQEQTAGFIDLVSFFQRSKERFYDDEKAETHDVELPSDFLAFLEEKHEGQFDKKISNFRKPLSYYKTLFGWELGVHHRESELSDTTVCRLDLVSSEANNEVELLRIDCRIWKCLFDAKINKIISHVKTLLDEKVIDGCKYIALVGGLTGSKYYQERMTTEFGTFEILIPQRPMLSVVEGAAYIAFHEDYIKARRLKHTYGVSVTYPKEYARGIGIDEGYIVNHSCDNGLYVDDCFDAIVRRGDRVALNQVKRGQGFSRGAGVAVDILCSDCKDPKVGKDGKVMATLAILDVGMNEMVVYEFHFYGTMFTVFAYPESNPAKRKNIPIVYENENNVNINSDTNREKAWIDH